MRARLLSERLWPDLLPSWIRYQDPDLIVIDKPAGVSCQAADPEQRDDLPFRLQQFLARQRGVDPSEVYVGTHQRLDQATSGLIVYTLDPAVNAALAQTFETRSIDKTYLAAVQGKSLPDAPRTLRDQLAPGRDGVMQVVAASDPRGKLAISQLRVVERHAHDRALCELRIETGRTHQIRVQLAALGAPVAGDVVYGRTPALRQLLHAHKLAFAHPRDGRALELTSSAPLELEDWLRHGARAAYADDALLQRALTLAIEARYLLAPSVASERTTAFRLLHEAADGLPGLSVEVFSEWLVVRLTDELDDATLERVLDALAGLGFTGIYLKRHPKKASDIVDPRDPRFAPREPVRGEPAPETFDVREHGVPLSVRLHDGLRTGLFLDQRDNRARIAQLASGKRVLNLFSYTGSFSMAALAGGASHVTSVDVSRAVLQWAERNVAGIEATARHRVIADDAFDALARLMRKGERFEIVIVDPPSYSTSKRGRFRVEQDYEALCVAALGVLTPAGQLLACLNHHGITQQQLRRFVREAAARAGFVIEHMKDVSVQRDFPAEPWSEPLAKSVLVQLRTERGAVGEAQR